MGVPAATAATHSQHSVSSPAASHSAASNHHSRLQERSRILHSHPAGTVPGTSRVRFDLVLALKHPVAARSFAMSVSTPGSRNFHHFLTLRQWEAKYGPKASSIRTARKWLARHGFKVGHLPRTHLVLPASGSAARVEKVFSTELGLYRVNGHVVRLTKNPMRIPAGIRGRVSGIAGVNENVATAALAQTPAAANAARPSDSEPPPPAGFRNPQPCSAYWNQKKDTADSASLISPYQTKRYDICGYTPDQLRSAYNVAPSVNDGVNGRGVTIGIVDAYDSPTLLSDAQKYQQMNDPSHVLPGSRFANVNPGNVTNLSLCDASGWYAEQSLDVESSHAMAPGANILYVGATSCLDSDLLTALQTAVANADVVSDSWGDTLGDILEDPATRNAYDNTFAVADATGVSVLFSTGDFGDNFADFGIDAPDYPAASPFITAVGGTSLEVGSTGARQGEVGWSTAKQVLCANQPTTNCGGATSPSGSLLWNSGGGGGTSFTYLQPKYQKGIVPTALAQRNSALFGPQNLRVIPDISMDADAQTGMLIGLTQTFPDGVYYGQFKEGGTSLASPLTAGLVADTDQASGSPLGFLNPLLYKADTQTPGAFRDIKPPVTPLAADTVRVDYSNTVDASNGYTVSLRVLDYEGPETYCDGTGNCATRPVTLTTTKGYDSLTGIGSAGNDFIADLSKF
jgi:subtilase family serine protease